MSLRKVLGMGHPLLDVSSEVATEPAANPCRLVLHALQHLHPASFPSGAGAIIAGRQHGTRRAPGPVWTLPCARRRVHCLCAGGGGLPS